MEAVLRSMCVVFYVFNTDIIHYYDPNNGGTIWRSAQTKSGIAGNRNKYDDFSECQLLKEIGQKNQIIFRNDEIIGNLKDIYIMPKCNKITMFHHLFNNNNYHIKVLKIAKYQ